MSEYENPFGVGAGIHDQQHGRKEVIKAHGRCGLCLFADLEHAGTFECRRFPPAPYFEPTGGMTNIRPRVGAYYWCGEYRPSTTHQERGER